MRTSKKSDICHLTYSMHMNGFGVNRVTECVPCWQVCISSFAKIKVQARKCIFNGIVKNHAGIFRTWRHITLVQISIDSYDTRSFMVSKYMFCILSDTSILCEKSELHGVSLLYLSHIWQHRLTACRHTNKTTGIVGTQRVISLIRNIRPDLYPCNCIVAQHSSSYLSTVFIQTHVPSAYKYNDRHTIIYIS